MTIIVSTILKLTRKNLRISDAIIRTNNSTTNIIVQIKLTIPRISSVAPLAPLACIARAEIFNKMKKTIVQWN